MTPFAILADLEARYPAELIKLAANEQTRVRDDVRIERALSDATAEMRGILKARYSAAELERVDADSRETLRIYAMHISLYFVSLSFSRQTESIEDRYKNAVKRLEAIATGKAALSFEGPVNDDAPPGDAGGPAASPNRVLIAAPERVFTRGRTHGL